MNYKILEVESRIFNRNIIQLGIETNSKGFAKNETKLIYDKNPYYIQHQLDAGNLTSIHAFEDLGFRFIEFRIFRHLQQFDQSINSKYFFPYGCELVGDGEANKKVLLEITAHNNNDDHFTRDPLLSTELAKQRIELFVTKSLKSYPSEFVYGLFNLQSKEMIGFRTGIFAEKSLVSYFYLFMKKGFTDPKYSSMLETGVLEELIKRKVNRIEAVTSGLNVQEMNDSSLLQGFVVDKTMVMMRKIY